jgi:hypothetical protein
MYRIALVTDDLFGARLLDLARERYVWVVDSAGNAPWMRRSSAAPSTDPDDPLLLGISSFSRYPNEGDEDLILRLLEMIDEHHGEFAHDPPWSEIEVFGARQSERIVQAAQFFGVDRIEETAQGFRMVRLDNIDE